MAVGAKDIEGAIVAGETELNQIGDQGEEGNIITVEATPLVSNFQMNTILSQTLRYGYNIT